MPLNELPADKREIIKRLLDRPTVSSRGPVEEFTGSTELYGWFLDHPDRAALAWRRLGAPCVEIVDAGNGRFGWSDGQSCELHWETLYRGPQLRIWYAEGYGRPSFLPTIPIRALVVLRYLERPNATGRIRLYHQADLFAQTDSKTAAAVARLLGPSVPRLAEQCVAQMQTFFAALVCYLDQHPERAEALLAAPRPGEPVDLEYSPLQVFFPEQ